MPDTHYADDGLSIPRVPRPRPGSKVAYEHLARWHLDQALSLGMSSDAIISRVAQRRGMAPTECEILEARQLAADVLELADVAIAFDTAQPGGTCIAVTAPNGLWVSAWVHVKDADARLRRFLAGHDAPTSRMQQARANQSQRELDAFAAGITREVVGSFDYAPVAVPVSFIGDGPIKPAT